MRFCPKISDFALGNRIFEDIGFPNLPEFSVEKGPGTGSLDLCRFPLFRLNDLK